MALPLDLKAMKHGIDKLSLNQKIGQIVMPRLDFTDPDALDYAKELVERYKVGCFIVMREIGRAHV